MYTNVHVSRGMYTNVHVSRNGGWGVGVEVYTIYTLQTQVPA
jgi:hypothetical protein